MKRLNFGCGRDIKLGWDNVDGVKENGVSLVFDFNKFPYPLKDNTYDLIYSRDVIEHLADIDKTILELYRISKNAGKIILEYPYYTNKGAYSGTQHLHYMNEDSIIELVEGWIHDSGKGKLKIVKLKLVPTKFGRFFPERFRKIMSVFNIGGFISKVYVELKVIK